MVIRVGMIGLSEGNGHPYSFSAIINGYDAAAFAEAGWPVILDYLSRQPEDAFGFPGVQVTHAWTQDPAQTRALCAACRIGSGVDNPADMLAEVDAVVVARDDWPVHLPLARDFLLHGKHVFIDKPLSLDDDELRFFEPYLQSGHLMSTSGLRYARELDSLREEPGALGELRLVSAVVLNGLDRYGVHMLDAVAGLGLGTARTITRLEASYQAFAATLDSDVALQLHCLGDVGRTFHLSVFGQRGHRHFDLHDNFSAFRRTLGAFFGMVASGEPPIPPAQTIGTMRLVAAACRLSPGETWVAGHE